MSTADRALARRALTQHYLTLRRYGATERRARALLSEKARTINPVYAKLVNEIVIYCKGDESE